MPSKLEEIVINKTAEVEARKALRPASSLTDSIAKGDGSFLRALKTEGTNLI